MKSIKLTHLVILLLVISGLGSPAGGVDNVRLSEADKLLQSPQLDLSQARRALDSYESALTAAGSERLPVLIRLARVCFILGDLADKGQRRGYYEKGRNYAETMLKDQPDRVEGYYWLALNLAGLADTGGKNEGRKLLPQIMEKLQRALSMNPAYDQAGAHRVLGRIYYEAPGWPLSVGDLEKSLQHLRQAVSLAPDNSTNHLYLGETLARLGQEAESKRELEKVLTAGRHAVWPQGVEDDRQQARQLLK